MKEVKQYEEKEREREGKEDGKMEDKEDFCLVEKKKKRPKENRGP